MSVPGPGDPRPLWPNRWSDNELAVPNAANPIPDQSWARDARLAQMADAWNNVGNATPLARWETILHLRVVRMKFNGVGGPMALDVRARYFPTWMGGRLSDVDAAVGLGNDAIHLNVDWFGENGSHWWNTNPKGHPERRLATALLHFLESSTDLPNASAGSGWDPKTWLWMAGTPWVNPDKSLNWAIMNQVLVTPAYIPNSAMNVRIEWKRGGPAPGYTDIDTSIRTDGGVRVLTITTPDITRRDFTPQP